MARRRTVEVYKGRDGKWWWRLMAANGEEIGRSEQGYSRRNYARRVAEERTGIVSVLA